MRPRKYIQPGERFGLLTVIGDYEPGITRKAGVGRKPAVLTAHICKCDCGKETIAVGAELRNGVRSSCGCRRSWKVGGRMAAGQRESTRYHSAKRGAQRKGVTWALSLAEWKAVSDKPCVYCGRPDEITPGRIDPDVPMRQGNVEPRCRVCGKAKGDMSAAEFRLWIRRLFQHLEDE